MSYQVVIQTAFIGDVFLSIPFLKRLKQLYPNDQIIYVAKKGVADFLLQEKIIDQLISVTKGDAKSYADAGNQINSFQNINNVFCLHRSLRSALLTRKIKAKHKFGFRDGINFLFYSKSMKYPKAWPDAIRQMALLSFVDPKTQEILQEKDWSYLNVANSDGSFSAIPDFFSMQVPLQIPSQVQSQKKVAIFPGSVWETKKWPTEYYSELARKLIANNYHVVLMGGPDEVDLAMKIQEQNPTAEILAGKMRLTESIDFLKTCRLIIGNDSSPSHLGASVGTPVLAIFGPTVLSLGFRPWNDQSRVIENNDLRCRPCGLHGHQKCPLGHHKCMKDLSVEQVFSRAQKMLTDSK